MKNGSQNPSFLAWMECLAEPTRMRLLLLLEGQELGVAELCEVLQLPQSTVSRHLKALADLGLTQLRRQGTNHLYRLAPPRSLPGWGEFWQMTQQQVSGWAALAQDQLRLQECLRRRGGARAFFAGAAGEWDRLKAELYGTAFPRQVLLGLLPPGLVVADLGCGTGEMAADLAESGAGVIAVDQSEDMLAAARRRLAPYPNAEVRPGALEALPLEDRSCEAALLVLSLTYLIDPRAAIAEGARILKSPGRLVILDLLRHDRKEFQLQMGQEHPGFELEDIATWLKSAGLHPTRCRPLPPQPQARGPALFLAAAERSSAACHTPHIS